MNFKQFEKNIYKNVVLEPTPYYVVSGVQIENLWKVETLGRHENGKLKFIELVDKCGMRLSLTIDEIKNYSECFVRSVSTPCLVLKTMCIIDTWNGVILKKRLK